MQTAPAQPRTCVRRAIAVGIAVMMGAATVGCAAKNPLPKDGQRTQYDNYDSTRNRFAPSHVQDKYGAFQPNLRGRLSGKE